MQRIQTPKRETDRSLATTADSKSVYSEELYMTINIYAATTKLLVEVSRADSARKSEKLAVKFCTLREAMLMLHVEWQSLNEEIRASRIREINEAAVLAKLLRTAAVCIKAACDLSSTKTADKATEILNTKVAPKFDYVAIVRPGTD